VSKEQSPPARKIIPYKKGGRRQSPFADMALQFSGTALDVAIQQREQESDLNPSLDDERTEEDIQPPLPTTGARRVEEAHALPETKALLNQDAGSDNIRPVTIEDSTRTAEIRLVNSKKSSGRSVVTRRKTPQLSSSDSSFAAFVARWKPGLHRGQLKMCEVLYNKTHAVGCMECETSFSILMRESGLSRRQSFQVISELEKMGFVERLSTPKHSTQKGTGSRIRFHLIPKI
jgi:hypothetical protein